MQECSKLNITGASVRSELGQLVRDLPYLFKQVVEQLKGGDMAAAVEYYRQFVAYAHASKQQAAAAGSASAGDNGVVPTLREVRDGRTEAPADDIAEDAPSSQAGHAEIDWDIGAATSTSAAAATTGKAPEDGGINWDFDLPAAGAPGEGPSISWDVAAEAADSSGEQPAMEVDW